MRTGALLSAGVIAAMTIIGAQLGEVRAQQEQQPVAPVELSQSQIDGFAGAALAVQRVEQHFNTEMQAAQNAEDIERLSQQAQRQAQQAIEDNGLSVDQYNAIAQAAHQNPELYATILEAMQQKAR